MIKPELLAARNRILNALEDLPENRRKQQKKKPPKYPQAPGVHNSVIKRLIDQEAFPGADNLIKICIATGRSSDYFLFGIESDQGLCEIPESIYKAQSHGEFDTEMLAQITVDAENYLRKKGLIINPIRKKKWLTLLFEYWFTARGEPDEIIFQNKLDLTINY